ncbi:FadR family transcriptional regulator [Halomonas denitrificans]|nr:MULTISPECIES: FadR/GntR family transcriptional regulator [Halomonas]MBY5982487.1 FadR family transcriptional regulator [Halomonas sp. DP5Y7-2]MBY6209009.1 FadR family transcriptional regulator [Halomonas sp. DP3Y7-2]MBY6227479.1 FadR family transcriptional regulator [Halomonas sp. DP3Y7-1]MED5295612.1 FadR/GntR family transcriptional regulator [Pseudomonadota bacterium]MBN8413115.1 FadR family transcriptional regulator [Halomonas litopenaei]
MALEAKFSLASAVYEKILEAIIEGQYPVNEKLPTEAQLCRRYEVSRPVLRDALARLKEDELVVSRRGSGSFVIRQPDSAVLKFAPISSIADIQRCFEFRTNVEARAAHLAALRRTQEQLDQIRRCYDIIDEANARHDLATDEDYRFHLAITEAASNHYYTTVLKSLNESIKEGMNLTRGLSLMASQARLRLVQDEHLAIVDAIAAKDGEAAEAAMRAHIDNARHRMFEGTR